MKNALNQLEELVKAALVSGADAADAVMIASEDVSASVRRGALESIERAESSGVGLRVFVGQKMASLSTTDVSPKAMQAMVERAIEMAKVATNDPYAALAPKDLFAKGSNALNLLDADAPDIEWLKEQAKQAEAAALSKKGISNSEGADASTSRSRVALVTSEGFSGEYQSGATSLSTSVIAGEGDAMERDYAYRVARHRADLPLAEAIGLEAAERALRRLAPRKVSSQSVSVLMEPRVARGIASALASALSGQSVARGTSFLKQKMGEQIGATSFTLMDDPCRVRGLGSRPFDAEGVQPSMCQLIEKGVLKSWLLDMRSANQLSLTTTGHASRGLGGQPHPSTTNLSIAAGARSAADMIAEIECGFYVTEAFGSGLNLVTGDYSQGASGYWIEKGELAYPVSEVTIASHMLEMIAGVEAANDLHFDYATNAPTLRFAQMMVAGV